MDPFLGEIRLMALNFAPRGWMACQGQILPINRNTALFALLGIQYGGDGRSTFALPDLRSRAVVGMGQGPGLSRYVQGQTAGTETETLLATQLPAHTHTLTGATVSVSTTAATTPSPAGAYFAPTGSQYGDSGGGGNLATTLLNGPSAPAGGGQAHDNRMPYLALQYCIATEGVFPQRQ